MRVLNTAEAVARVATSGDEEKLRHLLILLLVEEFTEPGGTPLCLIFCLGRPGEDFRTSQAREVGLDSKKDVELTSG